MADDSGLIVIGQSRDGGTPADVALRLDRANRHGLVAGATGTGKTVTLQVMAEAFSRAGVPVFAADVKGDLSGIGAPATLNPKLTERAQTLGVTLSPAAAPTILWDLLGAGGHPVRTTVSELGPLLLARLLDLTEVQEGVLAIAFQLADDEGLLLLDLDDLQAVLAHLADDPKAVGTKYGNVSSASVGAIQRRLLQLRQQGAAHLFGEPALDLSDLMRVGGDGRGWVSLLVADKLMSTPALYAVFLLWLMSELFEQLPEVGDPDKPKLVLFFDEAHLLFTDAPKALLAKIEQVVRLVRSKGVGLYFVTQSPADVPDTVLAQLGTRIEHALRAYTPAEQDALNAAARSFRANPAFDTAAAIQALGVGEALVSSLDERGAPTMVARTSIRPPNSRIGPLTPAERTQILAASPVKGVYDETVNRESAAERLRARTDQTAAPSPQSPVQTSAPAPAPAPSAPRATPPGRSYQRQTATEAAAMSLVRSVSSAVGSQLGRAIIRGVLGSLTRR